MKKRNATRNFIVNLLLGRVRCPVCQGTKRISSGACPTCNGRGWLRKIRKIRRRR